MFVAPMTMTWPRDTKPSIRLEQLRHDALLDLAGDVGALRRHGVDLVDEQDRRRAARRFLEDLAELGLALAVELPHDLRAVEVNEVDAAFGGDRAREQRLARARRTVEQHALRREDAQPLEDAASASSGSSTISRTRATSRSSPPMSS